MQDEPCQDGVAPNESPQQPRHWVRLMWGPIVAMGVLLLIGIGLLPTLQMAHIPSRRTTCRNNLAQIGMALQCYYDEYGAFPPAFTVDAEGNRLHSWRTLILPYLEELPLYERIDLAKPWNDPANKFAYETSFPMYQCPSLDLEPTETTYLAVVDQGACFALGVSRTLGELTDGIKQTLILHEVDAAHAVHWMQPTDIDSRWLTRLNAYDLPHGGALALFADGSTHFLSQDTDPKTAQALITINGDEDMSQFEY